MSQVTRRIRLVYVSIITTIAIISLLTFSNNQQQQSVHEEFATTSLQARQLYNEISTFLEDSRVGEKKTVSFDPNDELENNILSSTENEETEEFLLNFFIQGTSCEGENELVRLVEGVAICCGQCDDDVQLSFPDDVMCSPATNIWRQCNQYTPGNLGRVAAECSLLESEAFVYDEEGELLGSAQPQSQWGTYLIYDVDMYVGVGDYDIVVSCGEQIQQSLIVRIPSPGGGGGGGGAGTSPPPPASNDPPRARFIAVPTSGSAPLLTSFDGSASFDNDGSISSYDWNFGDGSTATGQTATHTYHVYGNYTVSLRVTDNDGSTNTLTEEIAVFPSPPRVLFTHPEYNGIYDQSTLLVDFAIYGFLIEGQNQPHVEFTTNGSVFNFYNGDDDVVLENDVPTTGATWNNDSSFYLNNLTPSPYTLTAILVDENANALTNPEATSTVIFSIDLPLGECGNGVMNANEFCDDGNLDNNDGCSDVCEIEANYVCTGEPSTCLVDSDGDTIADTIDNCINEVNTNQLDSDSDGQGDVCDVCPLDATNDQDGDGVCQDVDNCPAISNLNQLDDDNDGQGNACDICPADAENDADGDGVCGTLDNCPLVNNPSQADCDGDNVGNACDMDSSCSSDSDGDGQADNVDNCPEVANADQLDDDNDGQGNVCDACPLDANNDGDGDGVCGNVDVCPFVSDPSQLDNDGDGFGNACDICIDDSSNDVDGDGVCGNVDNCPLDTNALQLDCDGDGAGNVCDLDSSCSTDTDGDGIFDDVDNCPLISNANQLDSDADIIGDVCDACPNDVKNDGDGDGFCADVDNCPFLNNPFQIDSDGDGLGDVCDAETCGNSIVEGTEVCEVGDTATCSESGYQGTTTCLNDCSGYVSSCQTTEFCGDSTINGPEQCDGSQLNGASCISQGYIGGTLSCSNICEYDESSCTSLTEVIAAFTVSPTQGTVNTIFSFNAASSDGGGESIINYEWDFDNDGTIDASGITASHQYSQTHTQGILAVLTVTTTTFRQDSFSVNVIVSPPGGTDCSDGIDNDGDGLIDYPIDPGCGSLDDDEDGNPTSQPLVTHMWNDAKENGVTTTYTNLFKAPILRRDTTASELKTALDALPEGQRVAQTFINYMFVDDSANHLLGGAHPLDKCVDPDTLELTSFSCPWWDNGIAEVQPRFDSLFSAFSAIGGDIDGIVYDYEAGQNIAWQITSLAGYQAITNDPRWSQPDPVLNNGRSIPEQMCFIEQQTCDGSADQPSSCNLGTRLCTLVDNPDLFAQEVNNDRSTGGSYHQLHVWNEVMYDRSAIQMYVAATSQIERYFPNVKTQNYDYKSHSSEYKVPNFHGGRIYDYGDGSVMNTVQGPNIYGLLGNVIPSGIEGVSNFERTPFNAVLFDVNILRSSRLSSTAPVIPWITYKSDDDPVHESVYANSDYYHEALFHFALTLNDDESFFYWNPNDLSTPNVLKGPFDDRAVYETATEFNELAGFSGRQTLVSDLAPWEDDFVLTGTLSGNRKIWRFTPNSLIGNDIENYITSEDGRVILEINNVGIVFPQGVVYRPANPVSDYGLWIVQPASAQDPTSGNLVDSSMCTLGEVYGNTVTPYATCEQHIAPNLRLSEYDLEYLGVQSGAINIPGAWLLSSIDDSYEYFISRTQTDVINQLQVFATTRNIDTSQSFDLILDIEYPVNPRQWHEYLSGGDFYDPSTNRDIETISAAFKLRADAAKQVFPNAKIGYYGTIINVFSPFETHGGNVERLQGAQAFAAEGGFDSIDYLMPTVYFRWGPDDPQSQDDTIERYTQAGLSLSRQIKRTDGSDIPLVPLLSFRIFNENSQNSGDDITPDLARKAIDTIQENSDVEKILWWSATEHSYYPNIPAFFEAASPAPQQCICDLDSEVEIPDLRQCSDGIDNDNDGWNDASDPDCFTNGVYDPDNEEEWFALAECSDGIDNDRDGTIDSLDGDCSDALDTSETYHFSNNGCSDGIDNDGDGLFDYPLDPGCSGLTDSTENSEGRGTGTHNFAYSFFSDGDNRALPESIVWTDGSGTDHQVLLSEFRRFSPAYRKAFFHGSVNEAGSGGSNKVLYTPDGGAQQEIEYDEWTYDVVFDNNDLVAISYSSDDGALQIIDFIRFHEDDIYLTRQVRNMLDQDIALEIPFVFGQVHDMESSVTSNAARLVQQSSGGRIATVPSNGFSFTYPGIQTFSPFLTLFDDTFSMSVQHLSHIAFPDTVTMGISPNNFHEPVLYSTLRTTIRGRDTQQQTVAISFAEGDQWKDSLELYQESFYVRHGGAPFANRWSDGRTPAPRYCPTGSWTFFNARNSGNFDDSSLRFNPGTSWESMGGSNSIANLQRYGIERHGLYPSGIHQEILIDGTDNLGLVTPNIELIDPNIDAARDPTIIGDWADALRAGGVEAFTGVRPCAEIFGADIVYNGDGSYQIIQGQSSGYSDLDLRNVTNRDKHIARMEHFVSQGVHGFYNDAGGCPADVPFMNYAQRYFKDNYDADIFFVKEGLADVDAVMWQQVGIIGHTLELGNLDSTSNLLFWLMPDATYYEGRFGGDGHLNAAEMDWILSLGYQPVLLNYIPTSSTGDPAEFCRWQQESYNNQLQRYNNYGAALGCDAPSAVVSPCPLN